MATSVLSLVQNPTGDQSQVDRKKVHLRKDNFAFSFRPIYFLSRAFGLMPFSITYDANGEIQVPRIGRLDGLGFVFGICVQLILTYLHIRNVKASKDPNTAQYFLILCDYVLWLTIMIYGILLRGMDMYNRFKLVNILKDFTMFDKEMAAYGVYFNYEMEYKRSRFICIGTIIALLLSIPISATAIKYGSVDISVISIINFFGGQLLITSTQLLPLLTDMILMRSLHKRIVALNSLLRNRFLLANIRKNGLINTIKFTGRQHNFLTGIMDQMNCCFSFQMLINGAVTFLHSVLTSYIFYQYFIQKSHVFDDIILTQSAWEFCYLVGAFTGIYTASLVESEGKKTSEIAHNTINSYSDPDISASLSQLSQQVQNRHPVCTCGLFTFDWPLLFTMGAALTSYLTIILNFESIHNASRN